MGQFILNGRNYSGITYAQGVFIDTDNVIASGSYSSEFEYTATQDCCFRFVVGGNSSSAGKIYLNGQIVQSAYAPNNNDFQDYFFLKKGQTIKLVSPQGGTWNYTVYGIQEGSPVTFLSEYASACYDTNEREVGCWIDGKPLYQKTVNTGALVGDTTSEIDLSSLNIEACVKSSGFAKASNENGGWNININDVTPANANGCIRTYYSTNTQKLYVSVGRDASNIYTQSYVTILYTKTTDVAGSGKLTPTAMPTVHYDSNEKIIGTWFGETLYEKVISLTSGITIGSYGHILLPANSIVRGLDGYAYRNSHASVDRFNGFINSGDLYASIRSGQIEYWISNIFNPVEEIEFTVQYTKVTD